MPVCKAGRWELSVTIHLGNSCGTYGIQRGATPYPLECDQYILHTPKYLHLLPYFRGHVPLCQDRPGASVDQFVVAAANILDVLRRKPKALEVGQYGFQWLPAVLIVPGGCELEQVQLLCGAPMMLL